MNSENEEIEKRIIEIEKYTSKDNAAMNKKDYIEVVIFCLICLGFILLGFFL